MAATKKELKTKKAFIAPKALQKLAEVLDQKTYYEVEVLRDVCDAAEMLQLEDCKDAFGQCVDDFAEVIFGNIKEFGSWTYYRDENNGDNPDEYYYPADFDVRKSFVVIIKRKTWFGRNYSNKTEKSKIVIYAPEAKIDQARVEAAKEEGWIA